MYGIGFLIVFVVRLIIQLGDKRAGPGPTWVLSPVFRSIFGLGVRGGLLLIACLLWFGQQPMLAGLCLIFGLPQLVLSLILLPSGVPYLAYYFTRVAHPQATFGETRGGAVFNELRARLRWGKKLDRASTSRLTRNLREVLTGVTDRSVCAATLTARATLDALEGDAQRARELFGVVQSMTGWHGARSARAYCQAWLLSDAARRGDYHEVIRLAQRGPRTARRIFLRGVARRLLGLPNAAPPWALVCSWLLAPARTHTWSLLQLALRAELRPELGPVGPGLAGARAALLKLMRLPRGRVTRAELRQIARAWQTVFDSAQARDVLLARREQLQATFDVDAVAGRFEQEIVALLAQFWRDSLPDDEPDASESPLILAAKDQLQSEWLRELETLCLALPRGSSRTTDDFEQHWRSWARVRHLAQLVFDALPERGYLVFESVGVALLNHGAWLFNKERTRILAHDIFRFLLRLAPKGDLNRATIARNARLSA